ncbi:MBL fold metallo-hydrolase [Aspergillus affinis]|uniref:MBL fold metallo-hydrolase n=1 Tax=Aspergillus affinis TaxID=1070780 RepID=UPI0022FF291B|nr:metallo-beta-lactamase superfamily protein [Aspergillus affinis]KAI9039905.1 metallo-beta-lactamase superfamily protein [Aspergillus affinis]
MNVPSYAYLIKHPDLKTKYSTMMFDLGVRRGWENSPEAFVAGIKDRGYSISVNKDVATILRENGQDLEEVGAIIWSHWHFDHTGDPQTFPTTTDLIVSPGFKANIMPGYPTDKVSHVDEQAWLSRELHEIDFTASAGPQRLRIGGFEAYDFYGDGSFYLLNSPGNAVGHISALARTTADPHSFVLLGGDIAHDCGELRPTPYTPLPDIISPGPLRSKPSTFPGSIFLAIHPKRIGRNPFLTQLEVMGGTMMPWRQCRVSGN